MCILDCIYAYVHSSNYVYYSICISIYSNSFWKILCQLQKAIEGSTRSGVRLRPPLASFRDTIRKYSKPTQASSAPTSPMSSSAPDTYHLSSQVVSQVPLAPVQQQEEAEVWIEGVKQEILVKTESSSVSSSPQTGTSISRTGSPNGSPSQTQTPSSHPTISLSSLRPAPENKQDGDQESDDEEPL